MSESTQSLLGGVCSFHGVGSQIYIRIIIRIPDKDAEFPYTETAYCKKCWDEFGIDAALVNREDLMEFAGLKDEGEAG